MKRLLFLILLLPCLVYGQTVGIKVASPIIKNSPSDNTVTGYADLLNGGYHITPTISGRDSLNTSYSKTLKTGMLCYVTGVDSTYRWDGSTWIVQGSGNVTLSQLTDSLSNYTPLQDGLISGGNATIGTGSVTIDTAYYRIDKTPKMSLPRTFTGISNSASGTQYYILVYGKSDNTLDTLQGVQDTIATVPTKPDGTVSINTVLVGDGGVESTSPDLSGYALLNGGNSFTGLQVFNNNAKIKGATQATVGFDINNIGRGGFDVRNDFINIYGVNDSGTSSFRYLDLIRATKHARFYGTVEGPNPVNSQDFVTKSYGDANYLTGSPDTTVYRTVANSLSLSETQTALDLKANDAEVVHLTGDETIGGTKTFTGTTNTNVLFGTTLISAPVVGASSNLALTNLTTGTSTDSVLVHDSSDGYIKGINRSSFENALTFTSPLSRSTNTISINDATTSIKGIASFNSTNFSTSSGAVNTIQNINTTATPQFARLGLGSASSSSTALLLPAGTTSVSSLRIPNGVAPTTPVSGDWWSLTTGLRTQTYDGTQTKDVIFDKANSVFAGLGTGMIATNNSGDLSVVPIADRLTTNVISKTANYTVTLSDVGANGEVLVRADATSGNITITLPVASTATGLNFIVKKTDSSVNTVTVSVASTIDGTSTKVYNTQYSGARITSNGTTYSITGGF